MMDIRRAYSECLALIAQIEDALSDSANDCIKDVLMRQLQCQQQRRDDLCFAIRQERIDYWRRQGCPELADGDTQPVDTSAILHAQMRQAHGGEA
ncbi:MAG: hypothetical protein HXY38_15030 [Chloroflexi bacterium]|nr:hypothetical protein [Chloroflexota bacterium]